jgi:hypothetical protein
MDNNKMMIAAVVIGVVLVVLGGGYFLYANMNTSTQAPADTNTTTSTDTNGTNTQGTSNQPTGTGTGTMYVTVTDAAASMENITAVNMTVDKVDVYSNTKGWVTLSQTPRTFSLLDLKAKNQAMLAAKTDVPVDAYSQVRLHVSKVLVTESGVVKEAKLPSGELKLMTNVGVYGNTNSVVRFDIIADKSMHKTGKGEFIFAPVVKLDSSSSATVTVDANNMVVVSGGNINPTVSAGMDIDGQVKANFILDAAAKLDITGGVIKNNTVLNGVIKY